MATKKSKSSNKSSKTKSTKTKSAAKPVEETKIEASKTNKVEETTKKSSAEKSTGKGSSFLSGFFSRKYEEKESVLTIFKNHKFYGALLGEIIGTLCLTLLLFAIMPFNGGVFNLTSHIFPVVAIIIAVYAFSGACLNPLITVGMMATRRMSVIRGIMYIIAEVIGAWVAWLIFNAFHLAGGETAIDIPTMSAIAENGMWTVTIIELIGAIIIGFFFARALAYKRSVFTFAIVVAGGTAFAMIAGYVISAGFLGLSNNFVFNPATAMMAGIFPTSGEDFGTILGGICQALTIYALFPMIGGVIGFYLSDFTAKLSDKADF